MKQIAYSLLLLIGLLLEGCNGCSEKKESIDEITLADASVVWWMAPGIIAQENSIYEANKLKVNSFDVQTGLASKNAVLSGSADIGLVATTPLALGGFNGDDLIILCSYIESKELISIITKKTKDTIRYSKPQPTISVVKGTISELYLYNYLDKYFPEEKDILLKNQVNVKPPDIPNTMTKNGGANSASIWEPFVTLISNDTTLKVNRSPDVYTHRIYIVTTPKIFKEKKSAIEKFVKSIEMACINLKESRAKAQEIIKRKFPNQEKSMNLLWDKVDFSIKYDYEKMQELILKDAEVTSKLAQTPKDKKGYFRKLEANDIKHYFNHDFKPNN